MSKEMERKLILLAEDDPDDIYLISEAIDESRLDARVFIVEDGQELMDYLHHRGKFKDEVLSPRPDLILLDLNMPRKDGRTALAEIKSDPSMRGIPVVVLTTSSAQDDLDRSYASGSSGFVTKPASFKGLREVIAKIGEYWLGTVRLPTEPPQEEGKRKAD